MSSALSHWCAWGNSIDRDTVFITKPVSDRGPVASYTLMWPVSVTPLRSSSNRWQKLQANVAVVTAALLRGPDPGQAVWRRARWRSELSGLPTCGERRMSNHVFIGEEFNLCLRGKPGTSCHGQRDLISSCRWADVLIILHRLSEHRNLAFFITLASLCCIIKSWMLN